MTDLAFEIAEAQPLAFEVSEAALLAFTIEEALGLSFDVKTSTLGFDTTEASLSFEVQAPTPITFEVLNFAAAINPEDVMPPVYATRTDFVSASLAYVGEAAPGTLDSAPAWRIKRLTLGADDDVTTEWADGNANFDNAWSDRASASYA
jgi:hypothetical protein